jgi:fermentation-respiration switch protein FrsA (DUF1100 family)
MKARWLLFALLVPLLLLVLAVGSWSRQHRDFLLRQKGRLTQVDTLSVTTADSFTRVEIRLEDDRRNWIEFLARAPQQPDHLLPAIVILGGVDIGKATLDYIQAGDPILLIALDYPYPVESLSSIWDVVRKTPELRRAVFRTVAGALLVADYLEARGDVDTSRVTLVGYSFGAPLVPVIMSLDQRYRAAAIVYGGGDIGSLIGNNIETGFGWLNRAIGSVAGLLLTPVEPMRYVADISPRPLLMMNGTRDTMMPPQNARLLYAAAREPKQMIWIDSTHMMPWKTELIQEIVRNLREWLQEQDLLVEAGQSWVHSQEGW